MPGRVERRWRTAEAGEVTNRWCVQHLKVVKDTAHRDLVELVELGLLVRTGRGRNVAYRLGLGQA